MSFLNQFPNSLHRDAGPPDELRGALPHRHKDGQQNLSGGGGVQQQAEGGLVPEGVLLFSVVSFQNIFIFHECNFYFKNPPLMTWYFSSLKVKIFCESYAYRLGFSNKYSFACNFYQ